MVSAGKTGGSGPVHYQPGRSYVLAYYFQGIDQPRTGDYGGPVLVIVENRDLHGLFEGFFYIEAFGGFYILEIDPAEGRLEELAGADDLVGVPAGHFQIEDVYVGEPFEKNSFSFHDGFSGRGADIAQPQNGGSVGNDRYQVSLGGVFVDIFRMGLYFKAGVGYPGGVGQAQVFLRKAGFCGDNFYLAGGRKRVIIQSVFL